MILIDFQEKTSLDLYKVVLMRRKYKTQELTNAYVY